MSEPNSVQVEELHRRATVVNMLGGVMHFPSRTACSFPLPTIMQRGGTTAVSWTIAGSDEGFERAAVKFSNALHTIEHTPRAGVALTVKDIVRAKERGDTAFILNFQNIDAIAGKVEYLYLFYRLGLRVMQITYQRRNLAGDGCGEGHDAGLSLFGRELVEQLNKLGILIDLSHCGDRTTLEAIQLSRQPVAFTHVNPRTLNPHMRNKPDDLLLALADRGGVVGVNSVSRMLSRHGTTKGASIDDYLDHIDYLVALLGVDHVGIGLDRAEDLRAEDMDQRRRTFLDRYPELGGDDVTYENYYARGLSMGTMQSITEGLLKRKYGDADVLKVLGGNFLRLLHEVWQSDG